MKSEGKNEGLGEPKQIRFPRDVERDIQDIAEANSLEFVAAVRLAIKFGVPILRKRLQQTAKEAA